MAKRESSASAPTMIIPRGSKIDMDAHGQLSIRTPGNLVIQNSGNFGTLESTSGSIRIESEAEVEAVHVRCSGACYIEGNLTAWKVAADSIHLQDRAQANIVLQETRSLDVGRQARLVGNFNDEKELFLLFSRFASQLKALPLFAEQNRESLAAPEKPAIAAPVEEVTTEVEAEVEVTPPAESRPEPRPETRPEPEPQAEPEAEAPKPSFVMPSEPERPVRAEPVPLDLKDSDEIEDPLFFALVLLEREFSLSSLGPTSQRTIEELIKLLRERDVDTLALTYRTLFGRIVEPSMDVARARELVRSYFRRRRGGPGHSGVGEG
jgi:hypothetical protein